MVETASVSALRIIDCQAEDFSEYLVTKSGVGSGSNRIYIETAHSSGLGIRLRHPMQFTSVNGYYAENEIKVGNDIIVRSFGDIAESIGDDADAYDFTGSSGSIKAVNLSGSCQG